jgi:hypothetical protein
MAPWKIARSESQGEEMDWEEFGFQKLPHLSLADA